MTFWRRIRLFLIGVGLGLIVVWVIFSQSDRPSWTPEGRVLLAIDSSTQTFSDRALCQLKCLQLDSTNFNEIQAAAKVDFSESNTRQKPCPIYQLKSKRNEQEYRLIWKVCENDERVELLAIQTDHINCGCK